MCIRDRSELLHKIYAFDHCSILFKPTLAKHNQFRTTKEEFISYFLGQNKVCNEDKGFAIKNWKSIKFENFKIVNYNDQLLSMGNYYFEVKDQIYCYIKTFYFKMFVKCTENIFIRIISVGWGR